jgi:N6-adenosine-specific RNA methylase IME4
MTQSPTQDSAILYHNAENTIFLIDTPHSIALAQESASRKRDASRPQPNVSSTLSKGKSKKRRRLLLSAPPVETPFPSTEPKSHAARAKVLERIPASELRFHGEFIKPLVESALEVLRSGYRSRGDGRWCLPRRVCDDESRRQVEVSKRDVGRKGNSVRKRRNEHITADEPDFQDIKGQESLLAMPMPPVILSSTGVTSFESLSDLEGSIVKNVSSESAILAIRPRPFSCSSPGDDIHIYTEYIIPPQANFFLCTLPLSQPEPTPFNSIPETEITTLKNPIPALPPTQKFNLLLFDPPWPNRSVKRSGHYQVHHYSEMDLLTQKLRDILHVHSFHITPPRESKKYSAGVSGSGSGFPETCGASRASLAAMWITNAEKARRAAYESLSSTGFRVIEEWIWVKTTIDGRAISAVNGLWRKPYEILVIGRADQDGRTVDSAAMAMAMDMDMKDLLGIDPAGVKRRVIAAVPDLHSRKPNLKEVFERVFFTGENPESDGVNAGIQSYSALEVFARNLTAGWWACGNEVLKFNARECWVDDCDT